MQNRIRVVEGGDEMSWGGPPGLPSSPAIPAAARRCAAAAVSMAAAGRNRRTGGWVWRLTLRGLSIALLLLAGAAPAAATRCGNGLLEAGEKCDACPADCAASPACKPGGRRTVTVALTPQPGFESAGALTVLLAYRSDRFAVPGTRNEPSVAARLTALQSGSQLFYNDLEYSLRVLVSNPAGLRAGALFDVEFDTCTGATAPQTADLACMVESCSSGGAALTGCACTATFDDKGDDTP